MKLLSVLLDALLSVGCLVGVGFLTGKELQTFVGNYANAILFTVAFSLGNFCLRQFASATKSPTVDKFSRNCFGKSGIVFRYVSFLCCFVCLASGFAGMESCLQSFLGHSLPLYSVVVAFASAIILKKGVKTLKTVNIACIILSLILVATMICGNKQSSGQLQVNPAFTICYALVSVAMILPVSCSCGYDKSAKFNLASSLISAVAVGILICVILPLCNFAENLPTIGNLSTPFAKILFCVTLVVNSTTCSVANAMPIYEILQEVIDDRDLCCFLLFGFAIALSLLGFDFVITYGYVFVALVGLVIVTQCALKNNWKRQSI